ncbi:711_t:CDS:2 [Funneliformis caledonium]|uniref:711_t:CDS:1 n=1 Tax=Funneliformis caledonium TaxID=1117310 RepID=A0A9N9DUP7_9GLOM|nr:711_t:CDS:2 [Funneliformis caledonium]
MIDNESIMAAAINTTMIALIDAGIPMKDLVVAVSCVINKDDQLLLNPTAQEWKM